MKKFRNTYLLNQQMLSNFEVRSSTNVKQCLIRTNCSTNVQQCLIRTKCSTNVQQCLIRTKCSTNVQQCLIRTKCVNMFYPVSLLLFFVPIYYVDIVYICACKFLIFLFYKIISASMSFAISFKIPISACFRSTSG